MEKRTLFAPVPEGTLEVSRVSGIMQWSMNQYHYHNAYEIYYLARGERYYFIRDRGYRIAPGTLVLIDSGVIHGTAVLGDEPYDRTLITASRDSLGGLGEILGGRDPFSCFRAGYAILPLGERERAYTEHLLDRMQESEDAGERRVLLLSLLLLAGSQRGAEPPEENAGEPSAVHRLVSEVMGYIGRHPEADLSLSSVAAHFFVSPCHLSRSFTRLSGVPFTEYVNGVRIKLAEELLIGSRLGISEIGERVGYRSATHFGRTFRLRTGCSPRAYRARHPRFGEEK